MVRHVETRDNLEKRAEMSACDSGVFRWPYFWCLLGEMIESDDEVERCRTVPT